jgi:hypothetical protein
MLGSTVGMKQKLQKVIEFLLLTSSLLFCLLRSYLQFLITETTPVRMFRLVFPNNTPPIKV